MRKKVERQRACEDTVVRVHLPDLPDAMYGAGGRTSRAGTRDIKNEEGRTERMTRVTKRRAARVLTAAYSLLLPATAIIFAWRMLHLLAQSPADAAIIMTCVAVWATVRMDLTIGRKEGTKNER